MDITTKATAPSSVQIFNDQGVLRIPPFMEIALPTESAGSVEPLIGPVQDPTTIPTPTAHTSANAQRVSNAQTGARPKSTIKIQKEDNNSRERERFKPRRSERDNHERQKTLEMFSGHNRYDRHFIVKAIDSRPLSTVNTIKAYEELKKHINGTPKKILERRDGNLSITISDKDQSERLKTLTTLAEVRVEVTGDTNLNRSQGTIRYENHPGYTKEQLLEALKSQNVTEIYQLNRKNENKVNIPIPVYILTFGTTKLPDKINIGWTSCPVRIYIPRPRRCFKCQRFGHGATTCRSGVDICGKCGKTMHEGDCTEDMCCVNCGGPHPSFIRACPIYKKEQEIITYKTKNNVTYYEAKTEINRNYVRTNTTYSQVVISNYSTQNEDVEPQARQVTLTNSKESEITRSSTSQPSLGGTSPKKKSTKKENDKHKEAENYDQQSQINFQDIQSTTPINRNRNSSLNNQKLERKNDNNNNNEMNPDLEKTKTKEVENKITQADRQEPRRKDDEEKTKRKRESNTPPQSSSKEEREVKEKKHPIKIIMPSKLPKKKQKGSTPFPISGKDIERN